MRSVAARAGVDQSLVHRYFGTKRDLFMVVLEVPADPDVVLAPVLAAPRERIGEVFVRTLLGLWDSPARPALVAAVRTMVSSPEGVPLARGFLLDVILARLAPLVDEPAGSAPVRLSLVASQAMGLFLARAVIGLEPLASLDAEDVVALVAPTFQRAMVADLPPVHP